MAFKDAVLRTAPALKKQSERARAGLKQVAHDPWVPIGIALHITLTVAALQNSAFFTESPACWLPPVIADSIPTMANGLAFLALGLLYAWRRFEFTGKRFVAFAMACVVISLSIYEALYLSGAEVLSPETTSMLCAGAGGCMGVGLACFGLGWMRALATLDGWCATWSMIVATLGGTVLLSVLATIQQTFQAPLACTAMVVVSALLLIRCSQRKEAARQRPVKGEPLRAPWRLMLVLFVHGLSVWFMQAAVASGGVFDLLAVETAAFCIAGLIAYGGLIAFQMDFNHMVYVVGLPLIAAGHLMTVLFGATDMVSTLVRETGYRLFMVLSWILAAWLVRKTGVSMGWIAPCIMCSFVLGQVAGSLTGLLPEGIFIVPNTEGLVMVLVFLLMACSLLLYGRPEASEGWGSARIASTEDPRDLFLRSCDEVSHARGLTPREAEILTYLARGHNAEHISEKLGLSYGTVRTYRHNVYSKLDVHSQQELINTVEAMLEHGDTYL